MTAIAQFLSSSKQINNLLPFGYAVQEVVLGKDVKPNDWKMIESNQLFSDLLSLKKSKVTGINLIAKHELEKEYLECLNEVHRSGVSIQRIFSLEKKRKWIQADFVSNEEGQIVTFLSDVSFSINEKLMYSDILSSISDAVFIVNKKGELQFICPNVATIFGFTKEEVQAMDTISKVLGSHIMKLIKQLKEEEITNESFSILDKEQNNHDLLVNLKEIDLFDGSVLITCRDVTEKLQIQEEHLKYKVLLETIVNTVPDPIWAQDSEGIILYCNQELANIHNKDKSELIGIRSYDLADDKELAKGYEQLANQVCINHETFKVEGEIVYKDGSNKHLIAETVVAPIIQEDGSTLGLIGVARDITERKRETSKFKALFDQSPNGVLLLDIKGKIIDVNQQMLSLLEGTREEVLHKRSIDFTHPEDNKVAQPYIDDLLLGTKESYTFTKRFTSVKGKEIKAEVSISLMRDPYFDGGVAIIKQVKDIGEVVALNKERDLFHLHYQRLMELSTDIIIILNDKGRIVEFNDRTKELTGYEDEEFLNMHIWDLDNRFSRKEILGKIQENSAGLGEIFETEIATKSGKSVVTEITAAPILREGQNYVLVIGRDISERKQKERDLENAINDLVKSQQIANMGSWHLDVNNNVLTWSDEIYRIFGTEPQSFEGTVEAFYNFVHPDEVEEVKKAFTSSVENRTPYEIIHRIISKTGEVKWVEERAEIQYDEKGMAIVHGTVQDITKEVRTMKDLNQQVKKMNLALQSGGVIAWETDMINNTTVVFPEDAQLGFSKIDFSSFESIIQSVKAEHQKKCIKAAEGFQKGLVGHFSCEMLFQNDKGTWKWHEGNVTVLEKDSDNKPIRYFGTLQNIEQKKDVERLQIISQEEERARVSREIHDSIGQMLAATRMMLNRTLTKDLSMTRLKETNQNIDEMLADLIKESRFIINNYGVSVLDKVTLKESMVDLAEKMYKVYAGKINLSWIGKHDVGDLKLSSNIFRIFQESLTNAIKYAEAENINVLITNNDHFEMQIFDDGGGFDLESASHGFGMKNMYERAIQINGLLTINSSKGEGTVVKLILN